jgi:hypothetical protein
LVDVLILSEPPTHQHDLAVIIDLRAVSNCGTTTVR